MPGIFHIDREGYHACMPLKVIILSASHPQCCRRFELLHGITKGERESTKSCMLLSYILIGKIFFTDYSFISLHYGASSDLF